MKAVARRVAAVVVGLAAGAAVIGVGAAAGRPAKAFGPTTVAIVDITKVLQGLKEFEDQNKGFVARGEVINRSLKELDDQIKQDQSELQNTIPVTDLKRRAEKYRELTEKRALREARGKGYEQLMEIEQGEVIHVLYTKVIEAVANLAKKEGVELVLSDDRDDMTAPNTSFTANRRVIDGRQILFAVESLSLTDRLVTVMNNDYTSGNAATPATPINPSGTP